MFDVASYEHEKPGCSYDCSLKMIRVFVTCTQEDGVCPLVARLLLIESELAQIFDGDCGEKMKREWKRCTGTGLARVHQWPLAELSYPQLAPAETGEGGGALAKAAVTLRRGREGSRGKESEKPQAGGNRNRREGWKQKARQGEQERLGVQVYQNMT